MALDRRPPKGYYYNELGDLVKGKNPNKRRNVDLEDMGNGTYWDYNLHEFVSKGATEAGLTEIEIEDENVPFSWKEYQDEAEYRDALNARNTAVDAVLNGEELNPKQGQLIQERLEMLRAISKNRPETVQIEIDRVWIVSDGGKPVAIMATEDAAWQLVEDLYAEYGVYCEVDDMPFNPSFAELKAG